ncbi:Piwi domain-containing protein [Mycena galopus ATCC 62051]|nr:Piwi domain-containing protein [Mycena galopus ATCC 62051]
MPPRGPPRGRTQVPPDPPSAGSGRGTPARRRSAGRGGRGDGVRTAEASPQSRGGQSRRGTDDTQPARGQRGRGGSPSGLGGSPQGHGRWSPQGRGRGEEAVAPSIRSSSLGPGSSRGQPPRGRGEGSSTRIRSIGSRPPRRGHSRDEEEGEQFLASDLPVYRQPEAHITTVGVRRPEYGQAGKFRRIQVNTFPTRVTAKYVYQYDGAVFTPETFPSHKQPGRALNMRLMKELQSVVRPDIFDPPVVYDGRRKLYALKELDLTETRGLFNVVLDTMKFTIRLKRVGENIDTSILLNFVNGVRTDATDVIKANQVLDVALRMAPLSDMTLSVAKDHRVFYRPMDADELRAAGVRTADLGFGAVLWRGYFQSLRPTIDRLLVNVDVSTGVMYSPKNLVHLACDYLAYNITEQSPSDHDLQRLMRFIAGLRVEWKAIGTQNPAVPVIRTVKGLSGKGADREVFTLRDGRQMTVAEYFLEKEGRGLRHPSLPCVQVGNIEGGRGALIPLELCSVVPGQHLRTGLQVDMNRPRRALSVRPPIERLQSLEKGLQVLGYGQSDYVREFGVTVETSLLSTIARVLDPPTLKYRSGSNAQGEHIEVQPRNGSWNMRGNHFYKPARIGSWAVISYVPERVFPRQSATQLIERLVNACQEAGIEVANQNPGVQYLKHQDDILEQLDRVKNQFDHPPSLIFVVLPSDKSMATYTSVKHWGDIKTGIPTQCMKLLNCLSEREETWSNIAHQINMKLGGTNVVVDHKGLTGPGGVPLLGDMKSATVVMAGLRYPSYAAVVSSVDAHASKYVEQSRLQKKRPGNEIIEELQEMTGHLLSAHMRYRRQEAGPQYEVPSRLIFYRDGVSEDQFKTVLDEELPLIKKGCEALNINPKITLVIVTKRHHIRFFDKQENCRPGTVVDRDVVHPTTFDFYLQSHGQRGGGMTGRASLYSVLYDENNLTADQIQALSFALCHVYSCSTSAVSIPAPVYYAHRVCDRMANHLNPKAGGTPKISGQLSALPDDDTFDTFARAYKTIHANHEDVMYFV